MTQAKLHAHDMDDLIHLALKEDMPGEDISTNAIYQAGLQGQVSLYMKDRGILCGLDVFARVFYHLDERVRVRAYFEEGDRVEPGEKIADIVGDVRALLSGERVALNFLQRMSGIATHTRRYVDALDDPKIRLVDTRKTTPNMRVFEKYAVRIGGGANHRANLSDSLMLKDNHIDAAGGISRAVALARSYVSFVKKIEVEVETLAQVQEALEAGVDILMLDNMDMEITRQAITMVDGQALIECSGNVSLETIGRYKGMAIDVISSGAMTYQARPLDMSMKNLRIHHG